MRKFNLHFLFTVLEDLDFLQESWGNNITESQIRRNSPVLRNLLVEGKIKEAGEMFGQKLRILAPQSSLEENIPAIESVSFFMSGGASTNKGRVDGLVEYNRSFTPQEVKKMYDIEQSFNGKSKAVSVDTFLNQVSFIYGACRIKRKTVIKYVCNKLGGTHYDPKRITPTSLSTKDENEQYSFLDQIYNTYKSLDMNVIHLEMLGIGQRFINSKDIQILKRKIRELA